MEYEEFIAATGYKFDADNADLFEALEDIAA